MKLLFDYNKPRPRNPNVYVKLEGKPPKFLFEKEAGFAIRRVSTYSFFYKDQLYDFKSNTIKPIKSKAYQKYERENAQN